MSSICCVVCDSNDYVEPNTSNWPEKYYCAHCDHSFNPSQWHCPRCETPHHVVRNPFPDAFEYLCTGCGLVFPRLGPTFDAEAITANAIDGGSEGSPWRLVLETKELETDPTAVVRMDLRNVGSEPVTIAGRTAIAVQLRHGDAWWTLYGNPDRYVPDGHSALQPDQTLSWKFGCNPTGVAVKDLFLRRGPDYAGEYRFVYWGLEGSESVVATRFSVE